jgi:hypothetical protein
MRILTLSCAPLALLLFARVPAGAQFFNKVYYSPGKPLSPKDAKTCSDFASEWDVAIAVIEKDHQACLDAHTKDPSIPGAGEQICSRTACQSLHDIMFRYRRDSKTEIDACNKQLEEYQKAEEARKADEARRKEEEEARMRAAEDQRQKALQAAEEAKRRQADETARRQEAAKRAAEDEARRSKEREDRQKHFEQETKQRADERDRLARAQTDADSKLADALRRQQEQTDASASRQMDALRAGAAPTSSDADRMTAGFDFSGMSGSGNDDSHLFNIDASSAPKVLNEVGQRVRDAGRYVVDWGVDKALDYAKDQVTGYLTQTDREPYGEAVKELVTDALRTSESDRLDRGSWLAVQIRTEVRDRLSSGITEWLHDKSIELGAQRSDDPLEYQVNRTFSATHIWNVGFGFRNYLTRISDEGLKAISMGFGMITEDPEQKP